MHQRNCLVSAILRNGLNLSFYPSLPEKRSENVVFDTKLQGRILSIFVNA
jgi:hypothetical protein